MSAKWRKMNAVALGENIGLGIICPVRLAETFLDAIEAHALSGRIYARLMRERTLAQAIAARDRARAGMRRGVLDGVPISIKDNYDTAGIATEAGSALLKGRVPARDADLIARLEAAGMVFLGKTHMTELAFSGLGLNPITATPPCVNDPAAVPGGSSSGAAASVAFGLAPVALGSDTGGSVRLPAAWNDLVGLKTTEGRLSCNGIVPLSRRFDTAGPLARSVADAAAIFGVLAGQPAPDLAGVSLAGARFLVLETVAMQGLREAPAEGFDRAVARIKAAGAQVVHGEIAAVTQAMELAGVLYTSECWAEWREAITARGDVMFPPVRARFQAGAAHAAHDYIAALFRLGDTRAQYLAAAAGYDAVLVPTVPSTPPEAARLLADHDYFTTENLLALRNTRIGNLLGLCALTLPTGIPGTGISLMAAGGQDERLLRLGQAVEAALRAPEA
jgi:aspartyl-tRNA(Asn)/glutamyl-tRNA(Gln) amidotransferase subunit A